MNEMRFCEWWYWQDTENSGKEELMHIMEEENEDFIDSDVNSARWQEFHEDRHVNTT